MSSGVNYPFITFPLHLVAIKYPGYVYHLLEKQLYSYKSGSLKPMKKQVLTSSSARFVWKGRLRKGDVYYTISHKGRKIIILDQTMQTKLKIEKSTVPYHNENNK